MTVVRKAAPADARPVAAALARAFADDPMTAWMLPSPAARRRLLPGLFELELSHLHLPRDEVYTTANLAGGAVWAPPNRWRTPTAGLVRTLPRLVWTLRGRMPAAVRSIAAIERVHPREPHWYLAMLGTEASWRGRGIGSALLAPVLQRCDRDGTPAYLESSNEANIAFYLRQGFEVTGTVDATDGAPRVWLMWREPRP